ncbi:MAG: transposase [Pegethrix bostrychoides GSE-TBD4-15B]|jgi:transposase|uniref:Transposase n=1 Tax=Pegethrix bostrychoides GSE-TBD4-15B TaxID=2839662 RepID=A0A951P9X6_9CYAN|nr:transposase [Pegethrix bostrychoides GSE-TBD4-15B]
MVNETGKRVRKAYSDEFKAEAVRLVRSGDRKFVEVCRSLGIHESTLSKWVNKPNEIQILEPDKKELLAENKRLTEELRKVKLEQEILKKAAAYFAKSLV